MIRTLRWKFVCINMLLVAALMLAVAGSFITTIRDGLTEDSISVLRQVSAGEGGGTAALPYLVVLIQPDGGAVIAESSAFRLEEPEALAGAVNAALEQGTPLGLLKEYNLRYLRSATELGWKLAFVDISYERATLNQTVFHTALVSLGALVAFFFLSLLLAKWAAKPVEEAWEQQRQFVSDASHELKTPLTVILSNTELLERNARDLPDRDRRWLRHIRSGGERMQALVEELLELARGDRDGEKQDHMEPVDLSDLTRTAGLMLEAAAFEAGLTLDSSGVAPDLFVRGDRGGLKKLLDILLENALKYTQPGGAIRLCLTREGKRARLAVSNQGEPIPREELEAIFQRFYRGDRARSGEGFGLGLAIARNIVRQHQGKLWAESDDTGLNTFYCTLPAMDRREAE